MVTCVCGHYLADHLGAGYAVLDGGARTMWLRRRGDRLICTGCGKAHSLLDLFSITEDQPASH